MNQSCFSLVQHNLSLCNLKWISEAWTQCQMFYTWCRWTAQPRTGRSSSGRSPHASSLSKDSVIHIWKRTLSVIIKTTLPRGQWVSVLQMQPRSELPVRFHQGSHSHSRQVQVSEEVLKENSRHPGGEQNLHGWDKFLPAWAWWFSVEFPLIWWGRCPPVQREEGDQGDAIHQQSEDTSHVEGEHEVDRDGSRISASDEVYLFMGTNQLGQLGLTVRDL